jgi:hypothetical protein
MLAKPSSGCRTMMAAAVLCVPPTDDLSAIYAALRCCNAVLPSNCSRSFLQAANYPCLEQLLLLLLLSCGIWVTLRDKEHSR